VSLASPLGAKNSFSAFCLAVLFRWRGHQSDAHAARLVGVNEADAGAFEGLLNPDLG